MANFLAKGRTSWFSLHPRPIFAILNTNIYDTIQVTNMQEKTTTQLEQELSSCASFHEYLSQNPCVTSNQDVSQLLSKLQQEKGLQRAELIARSGVNDIYVHQILSGKRHPSRNKLLCLAIAMELEAEQVQDLLKRCGYAPLYAKNRRDSVILYGFYHKQPLFAVNEALYELGEPLLA